MDKIYKTLQQAITHLQTIEKALFNHKDYSEQVKKFNEHAIEDFCNILYSADGFKNQMPLADIIEYIFLGRGYYLAKNKSFNELYKFLTRASNLLLLQDSILSTNHKYRKNFLEEVKKANKNFSEKEMREILTFKDDLSPQVTDYEPKKEGERKKIYGLLDGLLPKILGTPNELIAFIHLIRRRVGIVIPLLLSQRLLKGKRDEKKNGKNIELIAPPDFLVITNQKKIYGIEVGKGKQFQENLFVANTGIPVLTTFSDIACSYRCPICKKWILFSDFVIENGMKEEYIGKNKIRFNEIEEKDRDYSQGVCKIKIEKYNSSDRHYHFNCAKKYIQLEDKKIFYYFPFIPNLEPLEKN